MFYSLALFLNVFYGELQFTSIDHNSLNDSIRKYSEIDPDKDTNYRTVFLHCSTTDSNTIHHHNL